MLTSMHVFRTTGRGRARRVVQAALAVAVAPLLLLTFSTPASAYSHTSSGSWPGGVYAHQVQGSHYNTCPGQSFSCWSPWIAATGPTVYRSSASQATQLISAVYQLQRWNGSAWANQAQRSHQRYLYGGSVQLPHVDFLPNAAGHFRLIVVVGWSNSNDTQFYGSRALTFNHSSDYVCNTQFTRSCAVGNGWVTLYGG